MNEIVSVTGTITANQLGFCQCHEHIALRRGTSCEINPALRIDNMKKSLDELINYRHAGGNSIIEAQPCGCCRMTKELYSLSKNSGVRIIASTGFHRLIFYPKTHWIHTLPVSELAELFVRELTVGMYTDGDSAFPVCQSNIRAGIIKTAYDTQELTGRYQTLFRAAALASCQTSRVIMIHVERGTDPRRLQDYLLDLGVAPKSLMFCHMDRACRDIRIHKDILTKGSYLEFDTIGRFKYHSDEHEIALLSELIKAGYLNRLLYSLDTTRKRLRAYDPNAVGLNYILNTFNPALKTSGITEDIIHMISVENPARLLTESTSLPQA